MAPPRGFMVTDEQVRLSRRKMEEGHKQEAAAAAAGMSERSARRWAKGPQPSHAWGWRLRWVSMLQGVRHGQLGTFPVWKAEYGSPCTHGEPI